MYFTTFTKSLYFNIDSFIEKYGKPPTHIVMSSHLNRTVSTLWQQEDRPRRLGRMLPESFAGLKVIVDDMLEYTHDEYKLYNIVQKGGSTYYYG